MAQWIWVVPLIIDFTIVFLPFCKLLNFYGPIDLLTLAIAIGLLIILLVILYKNYAAQSMSNHGDFRLRKEIVKLKSEKEQLSLRNEWLTSEMHHRVKNNLQILTSLINNQISFSTDDAGREALNQSKHRLFILSVIHQKLFDNAAEPTIEMSCCIREQVSYLIEEFNCQEFVHSSFSLTPLYADSRFAIPIGLIINELISNTLKIPNRNKKPVNIKIILSTRDNTNYKLIYRANGGELLDHREAFIGKSLGRTLVIGLSKQIRGSVTIITEPYVEFTMDFQAQSQIIKKIDTKQAIEEKK